MWKWIQAFASPRNFYQTSGKIIPWLMAPFIALSLIGLYWSFVVSPADYQQGESVRIMYVHVPAAWMSLFIYVVMAIASGIGLIWQIKLAHIVAKVSAPVGAAFTLFSPNQRLPTR
jgi:heme exporter protein C